MFINKYCRILVVILFAASGLKAQELPAADSVVQPRPFIISYSLDIQSHKTDGVAESYNGAMKTLFIGEAQVRSRMVSLMRVQSIFYKENAGAPQVTIVKESGDKKYYSFDYKIEVKNTGSTKLAFTNNIVQAYIIDGVQSYAAAGKKVDDFELEPGSTFVISYVANAAQLQPDGLDLDGMTLQINLYQNNDSDDLIARLEYLISIDK